LKRRDAGGLHLLAGEVSNAEGALQMKSCQVFAVAMGVVAYLLLRPAPVAAAPVYFLVTELPGQAVHHDSYVLPIEAPADIEHARDLIARGPAEAGASIAVAQIAAGADGINRNELAPGKPLWDWHVTAFEGFADNTVEILDGWPSFVEQDVSGWIANTNGRVGFWSYTITQELTAATPAIPLPSPLSGACALLLATALGALVQQLVRRKLVKPLGGLLSH
jgi:hypothetical protein